MLKSHPVPHAGVPFQPILNHKCTIPSPFSFEERDKLAMSRKQEKIEEIFEEEKKVVQCTSLKHGSALLSLSPFFKNIDAFF